jgi:hypothetical protein
MRVLSIQQPFAQLVVRGVKRIDVRGFDHGETGRIAIHASAAVPSKALEKRWREDRELARRFADQGWLDRSDLKALPRCAIVGTVELAGVHHGQELIDGTAELFAWNLRSDRHELARRDPVTGEPRVIETKVPPLTVTVPADKYAWVFVEPVEIEPIPDVLGYQKLWSVVGEVEAEIARREERSRKLFWRPPAVDQARRAKAMRVWKKQWESDREQYVLAVEQHVIIRREIARTRLKRETEVLLKEMLTTYTNRNRLKSGGTKELLVRVEPHLKETFDGRDVVPADEFELVLRRRLKWEANEQYKIRRRKRRYDDMLKLLDEIVAKEGRGAAAQERIRAQLEAVVEKSIEEEEEDFEFVRRELYPVGKERAERAAERRAQRVKELARKLGETREEKDAVELMEFVESSWTGRRE